MDVTTTGLLVSIEAQRAMEKASSQRITANFMFVYILNLIYFTIWHVDAFTDVIH